MLPLSSDILYIACQCPLFGRTEHTVSANRRRCPRDGVVGAAPRAVSQLLVGRRGQAEAVRVVCDGLAPVTALPELSPCMQASMSVFVR
jgi:hypothetical protein